MNLKINEQIFASFPKLETPRLLLTNFEATDIPMILECRSNPQLMEFMGEPPMKSTEQARNYVMICISGFNDKSSVSWAIQDKETNEKIGYIAFWKIMRRHLRAEIGYWIHPDFWGKGLVSEAIDRVTKFAFEEMNLHSIEACTEPNNKASRRVLEKAGFVLEAHFKENYLNTLTGKFEDSVIYSLVKNLEH